MPPRPAHARLTLRHKEDCGEPPSVAEGSKPGADEMPELPGKPPASSDYVPEPAGKQGRVRLQFDLRLPGSRGRNRVRPQPGKHLRKSGGGRDAALFLVEIHQGGSASLDLSSIHFAVCCGPEEQTVHLGIQLGDFSLDLIAAQIKVGRFLDGDLLSRRASSQSNSGCGRSHHLYHRSHVSPKDKTALKARTRS